jgi:hypothetical protein
MSYNFVFSGMSRLHRVTMLCFEVASVVNRRGYKLCNLRLQCCILARVTKLFSCFKNEQNGAF